MKHTAFFGDGVKTFLLTNEMIDALRSSRDSAIGIIYNRMIYQQFDLDDLIEIIRVGLIGGGMSPRDADALVDIYARKTVTPIVELYTLAFEILEMRWSGKLEAAE